MNDSPVSRRRALAAGAGLGGLLATARLLASDDNRGRGRGDDDDVETHFTRIWDPDLFFYTLEGKAKPFGEYVAFGELTASTGLGTVVLTDERGDHIVGFVKAVAEEKNRTLGGFTLHWADSVVVGGRTYVNTGRFANNRPAGLVVIAVIAILIGLLLPAVQKVKT